jgi:hypothetical protein
MQCAGVVRYDAVYFGTNTQFWLQSSTLKMEAAHPPDLPAYNAPRFRTTRSTWSLLWGVQSGCLSPNILPYVMAMSLKIPGPVRCLVK